MVDICYARSSIYRTTYLQVPYVAGRYLKLGCFCWRRRNSIATSETGWWEVHSFVGCSCQQPTWLWWVYTYPWSFVTYPGCTASITPRIVGWPRLSPIWWAAYPSSRTCSYNNCIVHPTNRSGWWWSRSSPTTSPYRTWPWWVDRIAGSGSIADRFGTQYTSIYSPTWC